MSAQKVLLGELIYPSIKNKCQDSDCGVSSHEQDLAGKITGMILEMTEHEIIELLSSEEALSDMVQEAVRVLRSSHDGVPSPPDAPEERRRPRKWSRRGCKDQTCTCQHDEEGSVDPSTSGMANALFLGPLSKEKREINADSESEGSIQADVRPIAMINKAGYEKLTYPLIVDPGAAEHVIGPDCATQVPRVKGPQYCKTYSAANGSEMTNSGEKVGTFVTRDSQPLHLRMQECPVTRPLASVFKLCEAGHRVTFNPSWHWNGCTIETLDECGTPIPSTTSSMQPKDGVYVLEAEVAPANRQRYVPPPGFTRQGQR